MNLSKLFAVLGIVILIGVGSIMVAIGLDLNATDTPEETGEVLNVTNAAGYREYFAPDLGTFEYPLAFYSVYRGAIYPVQNTSSEILFPGVITITPNDSVIYGVQFDTAYRLSMAAIPVEANLDITMLGTGPLLQYEADMFNADAIVAFQLNGVEALRIDALNVGPFSNVTDIIAVHNNMLLEILIDPLAEVNGTAIDGAYMMESILNSFVFLD